MHAEPVVFGFTVSAIVVDAESVPEVPVTVMFEVPAVAVELAVKVSTLEPVVGLVANAVVTPLGRPDAARVTLPVNPFASVTVMVSVALLPCVTASVAGNAASVKLPAALAVTVSAMVVVALNVPEVPVMVMLEVPAAAVLLAVRVSRLLPVVGLVPKVAVTPLGNVDVASVTEPVNPFTGVTVIVSVALLP